MAKFTGIDWTRSTFNPWIGCTKVGPGCDACYAEVLDRRFYAAAHWGAGAPRLLTSDRNWNQLRRWNTEAKECGEFWPVFCASQADVFDNEVPDEWRTRLWAEIRNAPFLTFQIVTKRIGNAMKMLPPDWGNGYPNVWIIATVVNQEEADRDIPKLKDVPAVIRGLSVEPMIAPMDLQVADRRHGGALIDGLDWVVVGGESKQPGHVVRDFDLDWGFALLAQCATAGVPAFFKQMGHAPIRNGQRVSFTGKGATVFEWPREFRVQEFPGGLEMLKAA